MAVALLSKALPSVVADFEAEHPYFFLPLIASLQTLCVTKLEHQIPDIVDPDLMENSSLLMKPGDPSNWATNRTNRRSFFSNPNNLA